MGRRDDGLNKKCYENLPKNSTNPFLLQVTIACICFITAPSYAAGWRISPSLVFGETYTDNVLLRETDRQEDYISEISPGVDINKKGGRVQMSANYRLQNLIFAKDSSRNSTNHNLRAVSTIELFRDLFFLDTFASASQQIISAREQISLDNFNSGANRTDVYSLSIAPYFKHRFGAYVDTLIRTNYDFSRYGEGASDSDATGIDAHFTSGKHFTTFAWALRYSYSDYSRESSSDVSSNSVVGDLRYRWFKRLNLLGQVGYEKQGFETSRSNGFRNGSYHSAGFEWIPSPYFTLSALYGERFKSTSITLTPSRRTKLDFSWLNRDVGTNPGVSWNGNFTLRTRRASWTASYSEETTTTQQIESEQFALFQLDDEGNLSEPPTQITFLSLVDEVVFRESARFAVNLKTGKSLIKFATAADKHSRELSMEVERSFAVDASWRWKFSGESDLNLSHRWQRSTFDSDDRTDYTRFFDVAFVHQLSADAEGSVGYRRSSRNSSSLNSNYDEDRIQLSITVRF